MIWYGLRIALSIDLSRKELDTPQPTNNGRSLSRLLVVDVRTGQITDYCKWIGFSPVWSPDGRYLAADNMIVDIANKTAYKITDGAIFGWLIDKPK
jgi:hypothetical protein